jgi:alkyl sulfatase BDS1-like metallo-beta-lactamase superfamily hydrolase
VTVGQKIVRGAIKQFGIRLGRHLVDVGIGPRIRDNVTIGDLAMQPTNLVYGERQEAIIAGLNVTFIHIPGETNDHIGLWIPSNKVFLAADDIYKTFPTSMLSEALHQEM